MIEGANLVSVSKCLLNIFFEKKNMLLNQIKEIKELLLNQ